MNHIKMRRGFIVFNPYTITLIYLCVALLWLIVSQRTITHPGISPLRILLMRIGYLIVSGGTVFVLTRKFKILQNKGQEYDQFVHLMREPIIIHRQGVIVDLNQYALEFLEADAKEDVIGQSIYDIVHPNYIAIAKQRIEQLYEGTATNLIEEKFVTLQGNVRDVEVVGVPVYYMGRMATELLFRDITKRKFAEEQLIRILERFYLIEANMTDAVAVIDAAGKVTYQSPSYATMLGRNPRLVDGEFDEQDVHPDDIDDLKQCVLAAMAKQEQFQVEYRVKHADGHYMTLEMNGTPVLDSYGKISSVVLVTRDVTERIRTEEALRQSDKLSAVGQLAAGVAHEIRNPLTAIKGFVQMLSDADETHKRYLGIILDEVTRIELISNELLMLAKPQAVRLHPCEVHHILQDVVTLLYPQALMKNVSIDVDTPPTTPVVQCDKHQMKQVFMNIIKNAIEAVDHNGHLHIQTVVDETSVSITIADNGHGIAADDLSRLGQPFYTTKTSGTGLGLMVSRKIIEHHGGSVVFTSQVNQGTTVTIALPRLETASALQPPISRAAGAQS